MEICGHTHDSFPVSLPWRRWLVAFLVRSLDVRLDLFFRSHACRSRLTANLTTFTKESAPFLSFGRYFGCGLWRRVWPQETWRRTTKVPHTRGLFKRERKRLKIKLASSMHLFLKVSFSNSIICAFAPLCVLHGGKTMVVLRRNDNCAISFISEETTTCEACSQIPG